MGLWISTLVVGREEESFFGIWYYMFFCFSLNNVCRYYIMNLVRYCLFVV